MGHLQRRGHNSAQQVRTPPFAPTPGGQFDVTPCCNFCLQAQRTECPECKHGGFEVGAYFACSCTEGWSPHVLE